MDDFREAMKIIGDKFSSKEFFLPELIMSGEILKQIFDAIGPKLKELQSSTEKKGKVLLGTVFGDIHDIGKDVVKCIEGCMEGGGYLVDGGVSGIPNEARHENVKAMTDAVHKYG